MATFKVGQRVKRIRTVAYGIPIGTEGSVLAWPGGKQEKYPAAIDVAWDVPGYECLGVATDSVAPLVPPDEKADAFIERIKKLKPEPIVPLPERVSEQN